MVSGIVPEEGNLLKKQRIKYTGWIPVRMTVLPVSFQVFLKKTDKV